MITFTFVLSPESCDRLHDALTCLAKFSDHVRLEPKPDQISLSTLNISRSAYVHVLIDPALFCSEYEYSSQDVTDKPPAYSISTRALLSVFKGRFADPRKENAVDCCEVSLQEDGEAGSSRIVAKLVYKQGITKTYRLIHEAIKAKHALFEKGRATSRWRISARLLREFVEYFGAKAEQLDMFYENGRFTLNSYTEKVVSGKAILKQPLQTAVSIEVSDFEEFKVIEDLHITISVKDFKNMVIHAETLRATVDAFYSQPSRPLQFGYSAPGMRCEFTLATVGDPRSERDDTSIQPQAVTSALRVQSRLPSRTGKEMDSPQPGGQQVASMAAPKQPGQSEHVTSQHRLGHAPSRTLSVPAVEENPDSLFLPAEDDDRQWQPMGDEDADAEDVLGWDASEAYDPSGARFRHSSSAVTTKIGPFHQQSESMVEPTQRASQIRGLFD